MAPKRPRRKAGPPLEGGIDALAAKMMKKRASVVHVADLPARKAEYGDIPNLSPELQRGLGDGFRPYAHQAKAVAAARGRKSVVIVSGTSSGKTVCYNVPVLEAVQRKPSTKALYLFPTKALTQDQFGKVNALIQKTGISASAAIYDADTPDGERQRIKREWHPSVILTNPDMLHLTHLAWHTQWAWFFQDLRYVVLDEVHTYKGVFGSHIANLIRRLRRIARHYGSSPQFIACSATIANAGELCERLCGVPFTVVAEDGSPRGPRKVVFWNPPVIGIEDEVPVRRRAFMESADLFIEHVRRGVRTINFARSRKLTERVYRKSREELLQDDRQLAELIAPYRAGYLADDRREIERRLFDGDLLGVVSTNALELGIDVGALDACILTAYPGTVASFWQQAGRAGRAGKQALITLIADDDALNQYWMNHPLELLGRSHENAIIDPDNPYILDAHVAAAARELPFRDGIESGFGPEFTSSCKRLELSRRLSSKDGRWAYVGTDDAHRSMSIRSISPNRFTIRDSTRQPLGEIEASRVYRDLHPGAVYLHQGDTYLVEELDVDRRIAHVSEQDVGYHTEPLSITDVEIIDEERSREAGRAAVKCGRVLVTEQVTGFVRIEEGTSRVLSTEPLDMPETKLPTKALWYTVPENDVQALAAAERDLAGSIHAAEHAMIGVMPLVVMCDRWDLGGVSFSEYEPLDGQPTVFVYEGHPGGVGLTTKAHEQFPHLGRVTRSAIADCRCKLGCPTCVQSPKCGNRNRPLDKAGALLVLDALGAGGEEMPTAKR